MPPHGNLERLIGTALIDSEFRARLLSAPAIAARGFDLSEEEFGVLNCASIHSFEELAAHVHAWITRAPKLRRATSLRWPPHSQHTAYVAV